jgi:hypothetical protein
MMLDKSYSPLPCYSLSLRPSCASVAARRPQILRPELRHDPHLWNWNPMDFRGFPQEAEHRSTHSVDGNRQDSLPFPIKAP